MKRVNILWTGGFDSTFRISELSRCDIEIQPYYICNPARKSLKNELRAIDEMTEMFKDLEQTKAKFLPLKPIPRELCNDDPGMRQAYKNIIKTVFIGDQYVYLCGFSRQHPGIELSVHDNVIDILKTYGDLIKIHDEDIGDYYVVDQSKTPEDLVTIFKDFSFPLVHHTKKGMMEEYKKYGLTEIMKKTWFCHSPIDDKPCGECNPCKYTIQEGLRGRFDRRAMFRYYMRRTRIKLIVTSPFRLIYIFIKDIWRYVRTFGRDIVKYSKFLFRDAKKYFRFLRQTLHNFKRFIKKTYKGSFSTLIKKEFRKFFNSSKKDLKKYGGIIKRDLQKYNRFLHQSYRKYARFFRNFYKDLIDG